MNSKTKRGLSPLLAVVILLGITVSAGGAVFSVYNQQAKGLDSNMSFRIDNAQAIVTSEHGDFTATLTNTGTQSWEEVTVALHTGLGEHPPLLYIHGEADEFIGGGLLPKGNAAANQTAAQLYFGHDLVASVEPLTVDMDADVNPNDCDGTGTAPITGTDVQYSKDIDPVGPGEQISLRMHLTVEDQFAADCNADLESEFGASKWHANPGETVMMIVNIVGSQGGTSEQIIGLPIRTI